MITDYKTSIIISPLPLPLYLSAMNKRIESDDLHTIYRPTEDNSDSAFYKSPISLSLAKTSF